VYLDNLQRLNNEAPESTGGFDHLCLKNDAALRGYLVMIHSVAILSLVGFMMMSPNNKSAISYDFVSEQALKTWNGAVI
jgi:hypothetical protein